jgi:hypothetical protein
MEEELNTADIILGLMSPIAIQEDNSKKDLISTGDFHIDESEMSDD